MSTTQINELAGVSLTHHYIDADGCKIHVVEAGQGPSVVLCHGFPELWLSWRNQIPVLAKAGYRVLAFDMRGHGESDSPEAIEDFSVLHTVGDVIAVLDQLGIERTIIVGHDAGTTTAYNAPLMRPDRFRAVVGLGGPYIPRGPQSLGKMLDILPADFYMNYFQEPGVAEREFEKDPRETLRRMIYSSADGYASIESMTASGGALLPNLPEVPDEMDFFKGDELQFYADSFTRSGFRGALNGYRVFRLNWALTSPWEGAPLPVPSACIWGESDPSRGFPGMQEIAARMNSTTVIEGAGHWVQAEAADSVNVALLGFLETCPG